MTPPNPQSKIRNPNYTIPLFLLLLAFLFMLPGLPPFNVAAQTDLLLTYQPWQPNYPGAASILRGDDVLFQQLPWHHWIQDELKAGRFPLWASGPAGGLPLFASYQPGVLYPLHLLWALLPTGAGFGIIMALKLWLAGLGTWLFLRALNLHPLASLMSAISFMFSAGFVVWLPWSNSGVQLLLPWLCWAVYAWCVQGKRGALVGLSVLTSCAIFGGNPEILLIVAVTVGIWTLGLLISPSTATLLRRIGGLALSVAIGGLIGAIQLLPFSEAVATSYTRYWRERVGTLASFRLDPGVGMDWILPRWWGGTSDGVAAGPASFTEANAYVGIVALVGLILLVVGIVRKRIALRLVLPWFLLIPIGLILAYDDTVGRLLRSLPLLQEMVGYRWIQAVGFAVIVLGAFGWDALVRSSPTEQPAAPRANPLWLPLGAGLAGIGLLLALLHLSGAIPYTQPPGPEGQFRAPDSDYRLYWALWSLALLAITFGAALLWRARPVWRPTLSTLLIILVVADLWRLLYAHNGSGPANHYYPRTEFIGQLASLLPPTERFVSEGDVLPANTSLVYNLRDWRYQEPMLNMRAYRSATMLSPGYERNLWFRYNMFLPQLRLEIAPLLGIRYLVLPQGTDPASRSPDPNMPSFEQLAAADGLALWEIEGVPGFAYLSDNVTVVPDDIAAMSWMTATKWEQTRSYAALVEAPAGAIETIQLDPGGTSPGATSVAEYTPGHIRLTVDAQRPALLVVAESYFPGWHATLDNAPAPVLRANYLSQGVVVPQGKHTVELKYEPDSFRNGAILSLVGLFSLIGLSIWWRRGVSPP